MTGWVDPHWRTPSVGVTLSHVLHEGERSGGDRGKGVSINYLLDFCPDNVVRVAR